MSVHTAITNKNEEIGARDAAKPFALRDTLPGAPNAGSGASGEPRKAPSSVAFARSPESFAFDLHVELEAMPDVTNRAALVVAAVLESLRAQGWNPAAVSTIPPASVARAS